MSTVAFTPPKLSAAAWPPPQGSWTYADYARLPDNGMRYEVLEGALHMSPAPNPRHQLIIGELHGRLFVYLREKPIGRTFLSPIDVRLDETTTVQPDLCFVSQSRQQLVEKSCINGAPDLMIEVLSPSRENYDRSTKFQAYAKAGVPEYWIVDPEAKAIEVNVLRGEAYAPVVFSGTNSIRSEVLPDLALIVSEVFPA